MAPITESINELSSVIGELRSFAQSQATTNTHILDELKVISNRLGAFGELSATFIEYRKLQHEKWGRVHEQIGEVDERVDKIEVKIDGLEDTVSMWKGQIKSLVIAMGIVGTIASALISTYGSIVLKALASHTS